MSTTRVSLLLFLAYVMISKIHIWEPKSLKSLYSHQEFTYTLMDFGSVPYGHSIYGTVFKATPYDACTDLKPFPWDKNYGTLIVMVTRGGCNFSEKVLNAQKVGAGFVLIADNTDEDVHRIFPIERTKEMLDKVRIPAVLISKQESENILKVLSMPSNSADGHGPRVELAIHFDLTKSQGKSQVKIVAAVDDYRCYDLLLSFEPYHQSFGRYLNYEIHYKLFYNSQQYFDDDECIGPPEAHYCASKSFGNSKKNLGLPQETLRQLCLKNFDYKLFIHYIQKVRTNCFESNGDVKSDFKSCTEDAYNNTLSTKQQKQLEECLKPGSKEAENVLSTNHENTKYFLINYSPIVFINGSYYKGNYDDINHLLEALCNSYANPPPQCANLAFFEQAYDLNSTQLHKFLLICFCICVGIALIAVVLFYIMYKKKIKKTFNFTLNDKINEALAKYYADEEKDGEGDDMKKGVDADDN